jgi:hypothetical protein
VILLLDGLGCSWLCYLSGVIILSFYFTLLASNCCNSTRETKRQMIKMKIKINKKKKKRKNRDRMGKGDREMEMGIGIVEMGTEMVEMEMWQ